jgi:hypothetical protein
MSAAWTREAVEALGPTTNVPTTAAILGVAPDTIYAAIRRGEWTATRVLKLGRSIKVPVLDIIRLLYAPEAATLTVSPRDGAEQQRASGTENPRSTAMESHPECGYRDAAGGAVRPIGLARPAS